jgi:hypothetical protein
MISVPWLFDDRAYRVVTANATTPANTPDFIIVFIVLFLFPWANSFANYLNFVNRVLAQFDEDPSTNS